jgi:hypothetical protein
MLLHGNDPGLNQGINNKTSSNAGFESTRVVLHSVMDPDPDPRVLTTKTEEEKN